MKIPFPNDTEATRGTRTTRPRRRFVGSAFAMTIVTLFSASAFAAGDASAASVLCQREKKGKVKVKIRTDACKDDETLVELTAGVEDTVAELARRFDLLQRELTTRVALAEEAATAPVTEDRLDLARETIRVPGVEGERSVTSEEAHSFCGLTRVLHFPSPEGTFNFELCQVSQNDDGTWTIDNHDRGSLYCDAECF